MATFNTYIETGEKRVVAGALDWPGWCRIGRDEPSALQSLADFGPRYALALADTGLAFQAPAGAAAFTVTERLAGNIATDFGAPSIAPAADRAPMQPVELERSLAILQACWQAFDHACAQAAGIELRKGPRGGGRDQGELLEHVLEAERAYLRRIGGKSTNPTGGNSWEKTQQTRSDILSALAAAVQDGLPERGPRGGAIWPARYFVRRVAWHVLDHAWEIEDRADQSAQ